MKILLWLLSLSLFPFFSFSQTHFTPEYYGSDHHEAEFTIIGFVVIEQKTPPTTAQVDSALRKQMRFMLGLMRSRTSQAAALYPKWDFHILENNKISDSSYSVKYYLKSKGIFANGVQQYTFTLPYNPKKIFATSQGLCMAKEAVESNFWYHWEPLMKGCPLKENQDYFNYTATLTPLSNTKKTYPEYAQLMDTNKTIKMTFFFGFEQYDFPKWSPDGGQDWGIIGFNKQREFLKSLGFTESTWSQAQIEKIYIAKDGFVPYISEFNLSGKTAQIRVRLILSDTGYNHNSKAFHTFLKESLENESVVVYNGHSGIGQNLNLSNIESLRGFKFRFNPNYQIYFLGSCVPYAYYTDMFFNRKKTTDDPKGTLRLDIFTYGQESSFANNEDHTLTEALVRWAQKGKKTSYQDMIDSSPNYYFGVNGDEDNPTSDK